MDFDVFANDRFYLLDPWDEIVLVLSERYLRGFDEIMGRVVRAELEFWISVLEPWVAHLIMPTEFTADQPH
ncbi:hypothetical protein KGM48_02565 [Patescibacteria group bacterium]|nr:hypothetical protein [Patescibacteria group bacterium]